MLVAVDRRSRTPLTALGLGAMGMLLVASTARADVVPPENCSAIGQPCHNAGPTYDAPGICVGSTCSRTSPPTSLHDPPHSVTYTCGVCQATGAAGTTGAVAAGDASGAVARWVAVGGFVLLVGGGLLVWGLARRKSRAP
jgi:hypothetical protein